MTNEQALLQCERDRENEKTEIDDNPVNGSTYEDFTDSLINESPLAYAIRETNKAFGLSEIPF